GRDRGERRRLRRPRDLRRLRPALRPEQRRGVRAVRADLRRGPRAAADARSERVRAAGRPDDPVAGHGRLPALPERHQRRRCHLLALDARGRPRAAWTVAAARAGAAAAVTVAIALLLAQVNLSLLRPGSGSDGSLGIEGAHPLTSPDFPFELQLGFDGSWLPVRSSPRVDRRLGGWVQFAARLNDDFQLFAQ